MDKPNVFRQKLDAGEPTVGCRVSSVWAGLAEVIGLTGQIVSPDLYIAAGIPGATGAAIPRPRPRPSLHPRA